MDAALLEILRCPASGQPLELHADQSPPRLVSADHRHSYPIVNGIAHLLRDPRDSGPGDSTPNRQSAR